MNPPWGDGMSRQLGETISAQITPRVDLSENRASSPTAGSVTGTVPDKGAARGGRVQTGEAMSVEGVSGGGLAVPTSDERTMSMLAHAGGIFFGFIPSLVIYLTKGNESEYVKDQAKEALNFQITMAIAYAVSVVLMIVIIGFLTALATWIGGTILMVMAAIAANNGQAYRYPVNIRLLK
jgi:uncharacterized Tic20 family protein